MKRLVLIAVMTLALYGANDTAESSPTVENMNYVPGLGDMMGAIQIRHAKLWFAGTMQNWELASYELDEIKEAFEDAVKYHPNFKGKPIAQLIDSSTPQPIAQIEQAIQTKNSKRFVKGFDGLSNACIACHQDTGYGFISIQRPTQSPFSNQNFKPTR